MRQHLERVGAFSRLAPGNLSAHTEPVASMAEAVVVDRAAAARRHPLAVDPFELVKIPHSFRRAEMNSRVADLHPAVSRLELWVARGIDLPAVRRHFHDVNQRWQHLRLAGSRIENSQPAAGRKPK